MKMNATLNSISPLPFPGQHPCLHGPDRGFHRPEHVRSEFPAVYPRGGATVDPRQQLQDHPPATRLLLPAEHHAHRGHGCLRLCLLVWQIWKQKQKTQTFFDNSANQNIRKLPKCSREPSESTVYQTEKNLRSLRPKSKENHHSSVFYLRGQSHQVLRPNIVLRRIIHPF